MLCTSTITLLLNKKQEHLGFHGAHENTDVYITYVVLTVIKAVPIKI